MNVLYLSATSLPSSPELGLHINLLLFSCQLKSTSVKTSSFQIQESLDIWFKTYLEAFWPLKPNFNALMKIINLWFLFPLLQNNNFFPHAWCKRLLASFAIRDGETHLIFILGKKAIFGISQPAFFSTDFLWFCNFEGCCSMFFFESCSTSLLSPLTPEVWN